MYQQDNLHMPPETFHTYQPFINLAFASMHIPPVDTQRHTRHYMNLPLTTQMVDFGLHLNTNQMEDKVFRL
jgi:hypothetical protein